MNLWVFVFPIICAITWVLILDEDSHFVLKIVSLFVLWIVTMLDTTITIRNKPITFDAMVFGIAKEKCGTYNEFKDISYIPAKKEYTVICTDKQTFTFVKTEKNQ